MWPACHLAWPGTARHQLELWSLPTRSPEVGCAPPPSPSCPPELDREASVVVETLSSSGSDVQSVAVIAETPLAVP